MSDSTSVDHGAQETLGELLETAALTRGEEAVLGRLVGGALDARPRPAPGTRPSAVSCALSTRVDVRPHDVADHTREHRVVGAAQDDGVDLRLDERLQVLARDSHHLGPARDARLDEFDEARARLDSSRRCPAPPARASS